MRIIVAGTSTLKYEATKKAVYQLGLKDVEVEMLKIPSTGFNEQPIGKNEILGGAKKRAELARENDLKHSEIPTLYLGIENGVEEQTLSCWFDYTFIFGIFPKGEKVEKTIRCHFPTDCVVATSKLQRGFKDNTVGKYMADIGLVKNHADPHKDLCGISRLDILIQSIKDLLISHVDGSGILTLF